MKMNLINRYTWPGLLVALLLIWATVPAQQNKSDANERYRTAQGRQAAAAVFENPERDAYQKPAEIVAALKIKEGDVVADVGAGTGYLTKYLVKAVGEHGRVYAEDIEQDFLDKIKEKIKENGWNNVTVVLGTDRDPKLPKGQMNFITVLDAYHHFEHPEEMLKNMREALAPDGKLAIIDYYRRPNPNFERAGIDFAKHIRLDKDDVIKELENNGFQLDSSYDFLPYQFFVVFKKK